jgi:hypothetical protein
VLLAMLFVVATGFLAWRLLRPMNIFAVAPAFERPVDTQVLPASLKALHASDCGRCHTAVHQEWQTTIHSRA